jgi:hypothetical protein
LACAGSARRFQFVLQPRVLAFEARPLAFELRARTFRRGAVGLRTRQLPAQSRVLPSQLLDRVARSLLARVVHTPVMPEFSRQYKSDPVTNYGGGEFANPVHL